MKAVTFACAGLMAAAAFGAPFIPEPTFTVTQEKSESCRVTVRYDLQNDPAIVTVDFLTNGVSIGESNFAGVTGDINRLMQPGERYEIVWLAHADWPDRKIKDSAFSVKVTAWATNNPPEYVVFGFGEGVRKSGGFKPATDLAINYYTSTNAFPDGGLSNDDYRRYKLVMKRIHTAGKSYRMGSNPVEVNRDAARERLHRVCFSRDYYMSIYPVTRAQFVRLQSSRPGSWFGWGDDTLSTLPAYYQAHNLFVDKDDSGSGHKAGTCFDKIRTTLGGTMIDLPTEALWEYVAEAGKEGTFADGTVAPDTLVAAAHFRGWDWSWSNGSKAVNKDGLQPVGLLGANDFGIYDMFGGYYEMCRDWYAEDPGTVCNEIDPAGPAVAPTVFPAGYTGTTAPRVIRGVSKDGNCYNTNGRASGRQFTDPSKDGNYQWHFVAPLCLYKW